MTETVLTVLAIMAVLGMVSLLVPVAKRLALPIQVLLALLGFLLGVGLVAMSPAPGEGVTKDVFYGLDNLGLSSQGFLLLFLPPLLFTAGLTIDIRRLLDEFAAVLLLAVVAVLVCTLVIGYALNGIYEVSLLLCLLLGAIVSSTDPGAVVGIFRDIGAPRRLSTLVEGEALFNDAAAIAAFTIILGLITREGAPDLGGAALAFVIDFAGGIAAGYVLARLVCFVLPWLGDTGVAEITASVVLAYLSYIAAQNYLGVSGVVAVVAAALTFAAHGRARVTPEAWDHLTAIWTQLEFWANAMVFVLSSMLASQLLRGLAWSDALILGVVIVAALAARALVLFGLLPLLSLARLVQPVGGRYKTIIVWGGLRGAVTLALALSVQAHPHFNAAEEHFIIVLATGFTFFTLFISAPTLRPLMSGLGLNKLTATQTALRDRVMALSRETIREQVHETAREYGLDDAIAGQVIESEGLEPREAPVAEEAPISDEERLAVGLLTLASRERELYISHFRGRTISRRMVGLLIASADRAMDRVKAQGPGGYAEAARRATAIDFSFRAALWLHRNLGIEAPLSREIADRIERLMIVELVGRELKRFVRRAVRPLLGPETGRELARLIDARLDDTATALQALDLQYPAFAAALRVEYLTRAALRVEEAEYARTFNQSLISREVYGDLLRRTRSRRAGIERRPPLDLGMDLGAMVRQMPLFKAVPEDRIAGIVRLLKPRLALPGDLVLRKDDKGTAVFFIASGEVEIQLASGPVTLDAGKFFGEMALLDKRPRSADVVAKGYAQLLVLELRDFRRILRSDPDLRGEIVRIADARREATRTRATD